jgi:hypothetical protein
MTDDKITGRKTIQTPLYNIGYPQQNQDDFFIMNNTTSHVIMEYPELIHAKLLNDPKDKLVKPALSINLLPLIMFQPNLPAKPTSPPAVLLPSPTPPAGRSPPP